MKLLTFAVVLWISERGYPELLVQLFNRIKVVDDEIALKGKSTY